MFVYCNLMRATNSIMAEIFPLMVLRTTLLSLRNQWVYQSCKKTRERKVLKWTWVSQRQLYNRQSHFSKGDTSQKWYSWGFLRPNVCTFFTTHALFLPLWPHHYLWYNSSCSSNFSKVKLGKMTTGENNLSINEALSLDFQQSPWLMDKYKRVDSQEQKANH